MAAILNVVGCLQGATPGHMVQQPVPPKREPVARPLRFNNQQLKPTGSIVANEVEVILWCRRGGRQQQAARPMTERAHVGVTVLVSFGHWSKCFVTPDAAARLRLLEFRRGRDIPMPLSLYCRCRH